MEALLVYVFFSLCSLSPSSFSFLPYIYTPFNHHYTPCTCSCCTPISWSVHFRRTMTNSNPPLLQHYGVLCQHGETPAVQQRDCGNNGAAMEECQLPLIDLEGLWSESEEERLACASAIGRASSKWGFFQVVNHGIRPELLSEMRREQVKLFETPFERKAACQLLDNSYRWGTPTATCPKELSWSEAFHIPLTKVSEEACYGEFCSLR